MPEKWQFLSAFFHLPATRHTLTNAPAKCPSLPGSAACPSSTRPRYQTGKEGAGRKGPQPLPPCISPPTRARSRHLTAHIHQHPANELITTTPHTTIHHPSSCTRARTNQYIQVCARARAQPSPAHPENLNFFFPLPTNHLHPTHTPSQPPLCARNTPSARKYGGQSHVPAPDRLRPRPHQTHPSRQRRHADSLVQPRPALLPGPLVVPPTPHRRSTRPSPRQPPRPT
jgi:hypothetical protein